MKNVVIFTGGSGSKALQEGFATLNGNFNISLVINAYDNGLSTGEVRKIADGKILGPSDLRKNQLHQFKILLKEGYFERHYKNKMELIQFINDYFIPFIEMRVDCENVEDAEDTIRGLYNDMVLSKTEVLDKDSMYNYHFANIHSALDSFFEKASKYKLASFLDFSIGNAIYAGLAMLNNTYSLYQANKNMEIFLFLPDDRVMLISDDSLFLHAVAEDGHIILDEGDIVKWNNPNNPIKEIYLVDVNYKRVVPSVTDAVISKIQEADIIIFSSGTQWSSLIPSYIHEGFYGMIKSAKAKKYLIMNTSEDGDMIGVSSDSILDTLKQFLPYEDIKVLFNSNANDSMKELHADFDSRIDNLGKKYMDIHDPTKLVSTVIQDYYFDDDELDNFVFDLDGTLIGRGDDFLEISKENLAILNNISKRHDKTVNIFIVTGNSLNHVNKVFYNLGFNGHTRVTVYCDGGNTLCKPTGIYKNEYIVDKHVDENYVIKNEKVKRIYEIIIEHEVPVFLIENRNDTVISIRPLEYNRKMEVFDLLGTAFKKEFGDEFVLKLNGNTTIDIHIAGYGKQVAIDHIIKTHELKSLFYIGDELESGNDAPIKDYPTAKTYMVENPKETNMILKDIKFALDKEAIDNMPDGIY